MFLGLVVPWVYNPHDEWQECEKAHVATEEHSNLLLACLLISLCKASYMTKFLMILSWMNPFLSTTVRTSLDTGWGLQLGIVSADPLLDNQRQGLSLPALCWDKDAHQFVFSGLRNTTVALSQKRPQRGLVQNELLLSMNLTHIAFEK